MATRLKVQAAKVKIVRAGIAKAETVKLEMHKIVKAAVAEIKTVFAADSILAVFLQTNCLKNV